MRVILIKRKVKETYAVTGIKIAALAQISINWTYMYKMSTKMCSLNRYVLL